jgi:hydrogenase maturation protease
MLKVIAIGNILRGDDGIGPVVVQELEKRKPSLPVQLCDVGSDAFTVLDHLMTPDPVVIIDCARMGKDPGTVHKIIANSSDFLTASVGVSLHGFSLAEILKLAASMGTDKEISIIGIEPDTVEFNSGLSEVVKKTIPVIIHMIEEEAKKYAKKDSHH